MIFCPKTDYMSVRHVKTCSWYIQYFTQKVKVCTRTKYQSTIQAISNRSMRERERERKRGVYGLIHHRQMNSTRLCAYLINNPIFIEWMQKSIVIDRNWIAVCFGEIRSPFPFLLKYSYIYFRVLNWMTSVSFLFKYSN